MPGVGPWKSREKWGIAGRGGGSSRGEGRHMGSRARAGAAEAVGGWRHYFTLPVQWKQCCESRREETPAVEPKEAERDRQALPQHYLTPSAFSHRWGAC